MKLIDALKEIGNDSNKFAVRGTDDEGLRYHKERDTIFTCDSKTGEYEDTRFKCFWTYEMLNRDGWEIKTAVVKPKYKIGDRFLLNDLLLQKTEKGQTYSIVKSENAIGQIVTWNSDVNGNVIYTVSTGGIAFPLILTEEYLGKLDMVVSQK